MPYDYDIVQESTIEEVIEEVRKKIKQGWKPLGGVAISGWRERWTYTAKGRPESETCPIFLQAIVRVEE